MSVKSTTLVLIVVLALSNLLTICYFITSDKLNINHTATSKRGNIPSHVGTIKKKRKVASSLEEDMKRCSLAMGMSRDELKELRSVAKKARIFLDALQSVWPQHFLPTFKNPCWYPNFTLTSSAERELEENLQDTHLLQKSQVIQMINVIKTEPNTESHHLFCLPHFFIAGFPKSGTTSLHETLSKHPQIFAPNVKEPHWWTRIPLGDMDPKFLKLVAVRYPLYFRSAANKLSRDFGQSITYDGTQSLLWDSNFLSDVNHLDYCVTPAIVSRILPDAKFIVLMRNPVTREYSNFFYLCQRGQLGGVKSMREDPPTRFHHAARTTVNTLNSCLEVGNHSLPWCLGELNSLQGGCGYIGGRFSIGLYYAHLLKWFQFYPRGNFLFLRTEDMHKEPHKMMTQITEFLEVDRVSGNDARQWLSKEANAQQVYRVSKYKMKPETKELLRHFYQPYNELLVNLIGDERFKSLT